MVPDNAVKKSLLDIDPASITPHLSVSLSTEVDGLILDMQLTALYVTTTWLYPWSFIPRYDKTSEEERFRWGV